MTTSVTHEKPVDRLQADYNATPYISFPFNHTHPSHLFTLAKLFGLKPKPEILELGCASGGNLIPMAYHFPQAEFLGIDLAEKQVEVGIKQIEELKLKNIELRHQSISDFSKSDGTFDYIICHGVYSWVNKEVREKILQICHHNLSKNGIAYVSYNTYPGWNMVDSVRDLMSWHTKNITDPATKAVQARSVLKFISDGLQEDKSPYAEFLRGEINLLSRQADNYLLHDHLSSYNEPVYFHQFMEQANNQKLSYLSDAYLSTMYTDNLPAQFSKELNKINNIIVVGQYMDFIRNQRFRCTLLCHQENQVNRSLKTNDIEDFYLQLIAQPDAGFSELSIKEGIVGSFTLGSMTLKVKNPVSQLAMLILNEERFKPIHYNDLCEKVAQRSATKDIATIKKYLNDDLNLMRSAFAGLINISSYPATYSLEVKEYPVACELVRYQAKNQNFVTNRRHEPIGLDPLTKALLPLLDGTHNLEAISKVVQGMIEVGTLVAQNEKQQPITEKGELEKRIPLIIKTVIENLAKQAVIVDF